VDLNFLSGMTTANLKLATLSVVLDDQLETPDQKLDEGEHIVRDFDLSCAGAICLGILSRSSVSSL
jgi:hypothetical protein